MQKSCELVLVGPEACRDRSGTWVAGQYLEIKLLIIFSDEQWKAEHYPSVLKYCTEYWSTNWSPGLPSTAEDVLAQSFPKEAFCALAVAKFGGPRNPT